MKMEQLVFLGSVSFLPCALRKPSEAFGSKAIKSWYPHYINNEEILDYVGPMPDILYYGVGEMSWRGEEGIPRLVGETQD